MFVAACFLVKFDDALSLMLLKFRMCKHVSHLRLLMSGIYLTSIHKLDLFC
jgi:hypothetical protein